MFRRFYYFEPPAATDPDWRETYYYHIRHRANRILKPRNRSEIRLIMFSLRHLLSAGSGALFDDFGDAERMNVNPAQMLLHAMRTVDISDQDELSDAQWREYFAALSIGLCNQAIVFEEEHLLPKRQITVFNPPKLRTDPELVAHASEAVAVAEALQETTITDKNATRLHNKQALTKRYQRHNRLKDEFVSFYIENGTKFRSRTDAGRRYFDSLSTADQAELSPTRQKSVAARKLREHLAQAIGVGRQKNE